MNKHDKINKKACPFCDLSQIEEVIDENGTMRIIRNRVPYDMFDGVLVYDHLMVTPKEHRLSFYEFTDQEKIDHLDLVAKYEKTDYNVYTRSQSSKSRSVPHLHTHLLKAPGERVKFMLYLSKPRMLLHEKRLVHHRQRLEVDKQLKKG